MPRAILVPAGRAQPLSSSAESTTLARQFLLLSVAGERAVLVDGRVAATWTVEAGAVTVTPLRRFSRLDRTTVAEEGRELTGFLSGGETTSASLLIDFR